MVSNARKLKKKIVQTIFQPVNWERFIIIIIVIIIIIIIIIINNMFIMKNLTYFRKTVETGTDPRLPLFTIF